MKIKMFLVCIALGGAFGAWRMNVNAQGGAVSNPDLQGLLNQGFEVKAAVASEGSDPTLFLQNGNLLYRCYWNARCIRWPTK